LTSLVTAVVADIVFGCVVSADIAGVGLGLTFAGCVITIATVVYFLTLLLALDSMPSPKVGRHKAEVTVDLPASAFNGREIVRVLVVGEVVVSGSYGSSIGGEGISRTEDLTPSAD
jgi:hypothetical protein